MLLGVHNLDDDRRQRLLCIALSLADSPNRKVASWISAPPA
jgi:hypothetical protein